MKIIRRILVILLSLLLTGTLALFCVSLLGRQMILPAMNAGGAPVSENVLREEERLVRERVEKLAQLYGFSAGPVLEAIGEETLADLNRQASLWWNSVLAEGVSGDDLTWDTSKVEQALEEDPGLLAMENREKADYLAVSAVQDIRTAVIRIVLPVRQELFQLGLQIAGEKIDLLNVLTFFLGVPWAALALCALLAGLIALLEGARIRRSFRYIGASLGAAALLMIALGAVSARAGIRGMIGDASESLGVMYGDMASRTLLRAGILTAGMIVLCVLLLALGRSRKQET